MLLSQLTLFGLSLIPEISHWRTIRIGTMFNFLLWHFRWSRIILSGFRDTPGFTPESRLGLGGVMIEWPAVKPRRRSLMLINYRFCLLRRYLGRKFLSWWYLTAIKEWRWLKVWQKEIYKEEFQSEHSGIILFYHNLRIIIYHLRFIHGFSMQDLHWYTQLLTIFQLNHSYQMSPPRCKIFLKKDSMSNPSSWI